VKGGIAMKFQKIALICGLIFALALPCSLMAVVHDYGTVTGSGGSRIVEPVQNRHGDPSPGAAASQVNNYVHQDEQINLSEKSGVVRVLRTDQKINVNDYVTELIPCKNASPRELRHAFRTICRKEGGNAEVFQDKKLKNYFLQVICPKFQLPYLRSAIAALDVKWLNVAEDGDGNLYYKAKFRPIQDILWISSFYRSGTGTFDLDITNNALYYNDETACMGLQKWGISQIDIPPNQVLLDVTVYEVDAQNNSKIGLDWIDWKNGPGRNLFEAIFSSQHSHSRIKSNINGIEDLCRMDVDNDYRWARVQAVATTEFIDFLAVKGKAREMIKTQLLIQSGHFAMADAIDQVVSINAEHDSSSPSDEVIIRNPSVSSPCSEGNGGVSGLPQAHNRWVHFTQTGQVGVLTAFRPFIGLESMELELDVYASSVTANDANGMPVIGTRNVSTSIRLKDGESFVIGGLKRSTDIKRSVKVPLLGSIPILGYFFGQETDTSRESEVVIVVKPKFIIGTDSDMEMPENVKTLIAQAKGEEMLELPKTKVGFDQWLLDSEK
jgi:type II/III secretion system protein